MALLVDLLLTLLWGTKASFTHPGILLPSTESTSDAELKDIIKKTQRSRDARETLGYSAQVWKTLMETLWAGNEQLSANKHHLLPKIWDLAILGRNLLAAKEKAQNLAAGEGFEAEIRRLLCICIDKASKPVPPDLDKAAHDKEMQVKCAYKKVLITSLQFLNNLMTNNETRKLHLWLHLFGTPSSVSATSNQSTSKPSTKKSKGTSKAQPASGSGIGVANSSGAGSSSSHTETAAKCNSLSAGFNAKYYKPGFLTEVPRLLQPDEIEPLHMILQNGVVAFEGADQAMQAVRCKLMLAQGYGRSLLREVLVFLGAWELDEHDLCYRVIAQVIEAILLNGLVPYAYECFRDEKDIVTPAQSVLLKLLISVYRSQSSPRPASICLSPVPGTQPPSPSSANSSPLDTYEAPPIIETSIPVFFVGVFRKQVLPPVIKIIQLQGAIKAGKEKKEAFELSVWDLDRVYEGVYQFLELMVLFSEDETSKLVLVKGELELVGDLVQFLGELDMAIPRYIASKARRQSDAAKQAKKEEKVPMKVENPYMVERPFDIGGDGLDSGDGDGTSSEPDDDGDPEQDLADPDEFNWPNTKRHIVTLLTSFAWDNRSVQDLVRERGGLQVVLNQCRIDDDNPYIREHAILCIRALLDKNPENQKIVEQLDAKETVPSEVLDKHGYETVIDENGKVRLQRTAEKGKA